MKIKIIGAGWYGSHLASVLMQQVTTRTGAKAHTVKLVDREGIFAGASGANQSRLHQGWHYPRCSVTRKCSQRYRKDFLERYEFLTSKIATCIYAVADDSLLDWTSYLASMQATDPGPYSVILDDPPTNELTDTPLVYGGAAAANQGDPRWNNFGNDLPSELEIANCQGAVWVDESLVMEDRAREYFEQHLKDVFAVEDIAADKLPDPEYDLVIDCTYAAFNDRGITCYESCVLWRLRGSGRLGFTVMDGNFASIMPSYMGGGEATLTGPEHTPIKQVETYAEALKVIEAFNDSPDWQHANLDRQYAVMRRYLTNVDELYPECLGYRLGIRAKPFGPADTRQCDVFRGDGNVIHVRPGKIDAIFIAEERVTSELRKMGA